MLAQGLCAACGCLRSGATCVGAPLLHCSEVAQLSLACHALFLPPAADQQAEQLPI